eukprot:UN01013
MMNIDDIFSLNGISWLANSISSGTINYNGIYLSPPHRPDDFGLDWTNDMMDFLPLEIRTGSKK